MSGWLKTSHQNHIHYLIGLNGGRNQYPEKNHRAVMSNCMPCCIKHISRVKPTNLWRWLMTFRHTMWYKVMALWEEKKAYRWKIAELALNNNHSLTKLELTSWVWKMAVMCCSWECLSWNNSPQIDMLPHSWHIILILSQPVFALTP
jgi:hypothetical protein